MSITLTPGSILNNQQLVDLFMCAPQGGMRRSLRTNTLILVSDRTGMYEDRVEGDVFHYTGMGQVGDQTLSSQNKTLAESQENGVAVHYFEVLKPREYTYIGEVGLVDSPYIGRQKDKNGTMRDVWIFPLRIIQNKEDLIQEIELLEKELEADQHIAETEKERIVKSRIGHSAFKRKLLSESNTCAVCGVDDERFLIASHIKPWSQSTNEERLDVNNGLLLCPSHDSLFDKGFISFEKEGNIIISTDLSQNTTIFMNVNSSMSLRNGLFSKKQTYLSWHSQHHFRR